MTLKEHAKLNKISLRTVMRWKANGVNFDDPASVAAYRDNRIHGGPGSLDAKQPVEPTPAIKPNPAPALPQVARPTNVDDQISMLAGFVAQAANDLAEARRTRQPQRVVSLANKTLCETVGKLADITLSRDQLRQNAEQGLPLSDILAVFAQFAEMLRWLVFEALPVSIFHGLEVANLVDGTKQAEVEDVMRRAIKNGLFPALSDFGASLPELLLGVKREINLDERSKLHRELMKYLKAEF